MLPLSLLYVPNISSGKLNNWSPVDAKNQIIPINEATSPMYQTAATA